MSSDATLAPLLLEAARRAAGAQQYPKGALYVVATPIGNLADLGLRAIHVLALADAIACEDTRVSAVLLQRLGLDKPLVALHAHNEREAAERVLQRLARGERIAQVSDAGTPAISDPGARLVTAVRAAGHPIVAIAGPSSVAAALSVAGDVRATGFWFAGFVPAKARERDGFVQRVAAAPTSVVLFEAPHRVAALAVALAQHLPAREITVARELTKQHEQVVTLPAADWPAWLERSADHRRGEFVIVVHAPPAEAVDALQAALPTLRRLVAALPLKQAVTLAAELTGAPRNALYQAALAWRDASPPVDALGDADAGGSGHA